MQSVVIQNKYFRYGKWEDSKSRNTLSLAEIHLKIVRMNLQWIENTRI
jgi:hypothetical protein